MPRHLTQVLIIYNNCDMTEVGSAVDKHVVHSCTTTRAGAPGLLHFRVSHRGRIGEIDSLRDQSKQAFWQWKLVVLQ